MYCIKKTKHKTNKKQNNAFIIHTQTQTRNNIYNIIYTYYRDRAPDISIIIATVLIEHAIPIGKL